MFNFREPCKGCGKDIPDNEFHCYGGRFCENCVVEIWRRLGVQGAPPVDWASAKRLPTAMGATGGVAKEPEDLDGGDYSAAVTARTREIERPKLSRKDQLAARRDK